MLSKVLLLSDFGMMLVIWIVQVIIYPGFSYYAPADLARWHPLYTQLITFFVLPLMFVQLAGHAWQCWQQPGLLIILILFLIGVAWLITFLVEVPFHGRIGAGINLQENIQGLIRWNWPRTISWTLVFVLQFFGR